jgi:hypothetical protein
MNNPLPRLKAMLQLQLGVTHQLPILNLRPIMSPLSSINQRIGDWFKVYLSLLMAVKIFDSKKDGC